MPAPIPITRTPSDYDSFGSRRPGGITPQQSSFVGSIGGASFREPMAVSFGKDVSDIMDYSISRFATSTDSDVTVAPSSTRLESTFCRNFTCCGQALDDLHDLLQHYEECHVRFEDDEVPAMITDDDVESSGSSSASTSQPPSPRASNANADLNDLKRKASNTFGSYEDTSAFDTAVMRSPSLSKGKKRSFGQYSSNNVGGSNSAVHQSLRRALIDGGIGRRTPGQPSIYSPNSPFSTPGSSIPGTPTCDSETDAFFGNGVNPSAFSSLSIRSNTNEEHHLPSCAPPNLFFPASGSSAPGMPPAKRERMNTSNVSNVTTPSADSAARASAAAALAAADKPYKCPAPGCDKAYKQMNGLKYHRLHGHCNQNNLPSSSPFAMGSQQTTPTASVASSPSAEHPPVQSPAAPSLKTPTTAPPASSSAPLIPATAPIVPRPSPPAATAQASNAMPALPSSSTIASSVLNTISQVLQGVNAPTSVSTAQVSAAVQRPAINTNLVLNSLASAVKPVVTPSAAHVSTAPTAPNSSVSIASRSSPSPSNTSTAPSSPTSSSSTGPSTMEKSYICQVGACGKRYKNFSGLKYHYLHSGSHGLLGMQLLHTAGNASAKVDATGKAPVSTSTLSSAEIAAAAEAAQRAHSAALEQLRVQQAASMSPQHRTETNGQSVSAPSNQV